MSSGNRDPRIGLDRIHRIEMRHAVKGTSHVFQSGDSSPTYDSGQNIFAGYKDPQRAMDALREYWPELASRGLLSGVWGNVEAFGSADELDFYLNGVLTQSREVYRLPSSSPARALPKKDDWPTIFGENRTPDGVTRLKVEHMLGIPISVKKAPSFC